MQRWHVAYTDSRGERDACSEICDLGFASFAPMERHKRFTRGKKTIVERALFPRYIFARFDSDDAHWNALRDIDSVCDILCNDGDPSPVPPGLVEKLQRMEIMGLFDHTRAPNPFPPDTQVTIDDDGPFADFVGKVLRVRSGDRVDLLISYLNQELTVNIGMARLTQI